MGTNRRKAVKDRKKHRAKVERWLAKVAARKAKKVADRLLGDAKTIGIDTGTGDSFTAYSWTCSYHNSRTGQTTAPITK